jgi:Protein of unknown function DUF262
VLRFGQLRVNLYGCEFQMDDNELEIEDIDLEDEGDLVLDNILEAVTNPDEFYAKRAFRVIYQTNNFLLPQISDLINKRSIINVRPEYQRRLRWSGPQKSRLIESLLLNIPVPSVFFFESEAARYEVMDGQQRLNAIKEFLNNEFRLSSLTVLWPLNGMQYSMCPPRVKRGLQRAVITAIVLLLESDADIVEGKNVTQSDIRRFIFERLNTGGTRLNAQELRNAIYPGPFNDEIIEITRDPLFTRIWGIPPYVETDPNEYYENPARQKNKLYASMMDCQIVLRFFALREPKNIRGAMKDILDRSMEICRGLKPEAAKQLKTTYMERLSFGDELFGGKPFVLPADPKGRVRVSIALYDAIMVAIDRLWDHREAILMCAETVREKVELLLNDPNQALVLTGQGNTAKSVLERIDLIETNLRACI